MGERLRVEGIRTNGGTQARVQLDWIAISEYAKAMQDGEKFPPIVVFYDGSEYWLADGFHRVAAAKEAGILGIDCDVRGGTRIDAIIHACGTNAEHGVRRTEADGKRAIQMLWKINTDENRGWTVPEVAGMAKVAQRWAYEVTETERANDKAQRDRRIFELAQTGITQRQIADEVGVSVGTVNNLFKNCGTAIFEQDEPPREQHARPQMAIGYDAAGKMDDDDEEADEIEKAWERLSEDCARCIHNRTVKVDGEYVYICAATNEQMSLDYNPYPCFDEDTDTLTLFQAEKRAHVSNNSGNNEWYTPANIIEAARAVMGSIDLDPASSDVANQTVGATKYFTADDDGLTHEWFGNVWMNPPYASPLIAQFATKMRDEVQNGNVIQAMALVNNATETEWFQILVKKSSAICFPSSRVKFWKPDGEVGAPLQGQALIYFGQNKKGFAAACKNLGWIAWI